MKYLVTLHQVPVKSVEKVKSVARRCVPVGFRASRILRLDPLSIVTIAECSDLDDANDIHKCFIENDIEAAVVTIKV